MQKLRENLHWWIFGLIVAATVLIWYAVVAEDRGGKMTVAFLDVGQGDAIFIESPTGTQILIDGGPNRSVLREIGKMMPFYDRTLDMLVVTNPDKDHFAGFLDVLRSYEVGAVIEPGTAGASAEYREFEKLLGEGNPSTSRTRVLPLAPTTPSSRSFAAKLRLDTPPRTGGDGAPQRILARRGQTINLGGGAALEILFPDRDIEGVDTNDGSIVGKLTYGNTSFLLTGDTTSAVEEYLARLDGKRLDVDVLKAGHHGSRTSTSDALVGLASPAYAVISAGRENRYGHPHEEVLERLARFEVETLGTYERGTIIMESDGETVRIHPITKDFGVGVKK
jgi:competence protein ComEC